AFWPGRRRLAVLAYAFAMLVGGMVIFSTFHWASDVVAGILFATPIGWSTGATFRRWVGDMKRAKLGRVDLVLEVGDITKTKTGLRSIAFPAISCGVFGYPLDKAARVALEAVRAHAAPPLEEVRFVLFSSDVYGA